MTFLPVVAREMSVLSRRMSTWWSRAATAVIAVLVMLWVLLVASSHLSFNQIGSSIFVTLSTIAFIFALLVGMQATSDSVSEEKREGTLGLLFLTDLRGGDIVAGKLAAGSLNAFYALLGTIPMLSLALLLGGVTLPQLGRAALVLVNTMFLSLSLGMFVSVLSKNERKAMFACFVTLFCLSILPFVVSLFFTERFTVSYIFVSPIYPLLCVHDWGRGIPGMMNMTSRFWPSLLVENLFAWAFLYGASRILPRCANELPARRFVRLRRFAENYVFGKAAQRKRHRTKLLDQNAFLWLASRERIKPGYAWGIVGFFGLLFAWVWLAYPDFALEPGITLTIIFLIHFIVKLWAASEVCSRLIQDRRSGALELLLSSPLSVPEIARGQNLALRRIFRGPVAVLLVWEWLLIYITLAAPRPPMTPRVTVMVYMAVSTMLLIDLWALKWAGLRLSLEGRSIERVLLAVLFRILLVPALIFAVLAGIQITMGALQGQEPGTEELLLSWWIPGMICSLAFGIPARRSFFRDFRECAANRFAIRAEAVVRARGKKVSGAEGESFLAVLRRHWVISFGCSALLLLAGFAFARHWYWNGRLEREMGRLRAQGFPATLQEIPKFYPPVAARENAFAMLESAGPVMWNGAALRRFYPGAAAGRPRNIAGASDMRISECRNLLAANRAPLAAFLNLTNYTRGSIDTMEVTEYGWRIDIAGLETLAIADLTVALHEKQYDRFNADVLALLRLARVLREQPVPVAQQFAVQVISVAYQALEIELSRPEAVRPILPRLAAELAGIDDPKVFARLVAVMRPISIEQWNGPKRSRGGMPAPTAMLISAGLSSAMGSDSRSLTDLLQKLEAVKAWASLPYTERLENLPPTGDPRTQAGVAGAFFAAGPQGFRSLPDLGREDAVFSSTAAVLRVAVAAAVYREQHGRFPEKLDQIHAALLPTEGKAFTVSGTENSFSITKKTGPFESGASFSIRW